MAKTIRGTRDLKNRTILKEATGGVGRVRCPKCQNLAIPQQDGSGKQVFKCQGCGASITSKPL